jgi:hypothetical protein
MQSRSLGFVLMMSTALTACATFKPPEVGYDDEQPTSARVSPWCIFFVEHVDNPTDN